MNEEIISLVKHEFGEPPASIECIEGGLMHETYEVEIDQQFLILQISNSGEKRRKALESGINFYKLLENSEIPVPKPVNNQVRTFNGQDYTLVEKEHGKTAEDSELTDFKIHRSGKTLAKIHNYREFEAPGKIHFRDEEPEVAEKTSNQRTEKIREDAETLRTTGMSDTANQIEKFAEKHGDKLTEEFDPVLCHDDYSPDNLIFEAGKIQAVLDWDLARSGNPQRDLVKSANSFWMHDPCSQRSIREKFYQGYREIRGTGKQFEQLEPFHRVETLVRLVTSLEELRGLEENEKQVYSDKIQYSVQRAHLACD